VSAPGSGARRSALGTLVVAQALGLSGAPLVVMVGSIVGQALAPRSSLATLPLAMLVVGTALASTPVALVMRRVGRRVGFAAAGSVAVMAGLTAALAIEVGSFVLFSLGTFLLGATLAAVQQYRFAAAELGGPEHAGRSVALVLAGGIAAGVLGPEIGRRARDLTSTPWVGAFLVLSIVYVVLVGVLLIGLPDDRPPRSSRQGDRSRVRSWFGSLTTVRSGHVPRREGGSGGAGGRLLATPRFLVAVAAGVTAYSVMTLAMTAAPLAMHRAGYDVDATALAIQAHVLGMYAPSLVSGLLVARLGLGRLMAAGLVTLAASLVCGTLGTGVGVWIAALVLLGLGWNLLFLGGTVALTSAFPGADRFRAQALNDTLVFGARALASLSAGVVLTAGGWHAIQLLAVVPLLLMGLLLAFRGRAPAEVTPLA
jgi:predicted MFS family arabinose efflux permease